MQANLLYDQGMRGIKNILWVGLFISLFSVLPGCKKLVEVKSPPTSLTSENIYADDATAASVLTGIYTNLSSAPLIRGTSINSISLVSGLSADELALHGGSANVSIALAQFYLNRDRKSTRLNSSHQIISYA